MSREDIVAVGIRVFAIFLLVTVARWVPGAVALMGQDPLLPSPSPVLIGLVLASGIAISAYLWFFPLTIARKLMPAMREPRSEEAMSGSVALSVGLTLLGVWVLAYAVPDAIFWATFFWMVHRSGDMYAAWTPEQIANVVSTGAQLVLAAWLILGSSGIKRMIFRLRYGRENLG